MPCGGSGQVISNLGGSPQKVTCPWCRGSGLRVPNVDAQAAWRQEGEGEPGAEPPGDGPSGGDEPPAAA
jgi:hypothetical protein